MKKPLLSETYYYKGGSKYMTNYFNPMRVISCNFQWRVAKLKDIYEAVEPRTQTHLKSNQISIRRFPEVGWELVLEIDKRENIDSTVGIWLRQVGPCATNGLVNTKYKIYAIKNKNGHLPNSPRNKFVPMSESIDYMLISRSTNKLKDQQKLGYSKVLLKDIIIPKEQGADVSKIIEGSIHLYCEVKLVYLNSSEILQNKYEMILYDKTYADCIFKVGDEVIKAHRCILVQNSEVFKIMFEGVGMIEAETGEVTISDTTPECFRALLEYFYTGKINKNALENNVEGIFALAHKYQVETLQYECECYMANLLDAKRFLKYCGIISLYGATTLEIACKDYCLINKKIFFASKEWKNVKNTYPELASKCIEFINNGGIYGDYFEGITGDYLEDYYGPHSYKSKIPHDWCRCTIPYNKND